MPPILPAGIISTSEFLERLHELGRCALSVPSPSGHPVRVVARYLAVYQEAIEMARVQR